MFQNGSFKGRMRFLLLLFSLTFTISESRIQILSAMERDEVNLKFPYPCNATDVTLQYGSRLPFYRSSSEPLILTPDQFGRFTVEDKTQNNVCLLRLSISPVKKTDSGTYMLLANNYNYEGRVGLGVDFLPSKTDCRMKRRHGTGDWVELYCEAAVGSMEGRIQCYQSGIDMAPLSTPSETWRRLEQTILIRQNQHLVFCCSSPLIEPKGNCECNDFVWDPILNRQASNPVNPCLGASTPPDSLGFKHATEYRTVTAAKPNAAHMAQFAEKKSNNPNQKSKAVINILNYYIVILVLMAIIVTAP